jgi:hypothetical protein
MYNIIIDKELILDELRLVVINEYKLGSMLECFHSELIELSIMAVLEIVRYNGCIYYFTDLYEDVYMDYDFNTFISVVQDLDNKLPIHDRVVNNSLKVIFNYLPSNNFLLERIDMDLSNIKLIEAEKYFVLL